MLHQLHQLHRLNLTAVTFRKSRLLLSKAMSSFIGDLPLYDGKFSLIGTIPATKLIEYEKHGYKSVLYLCTDQGTDFG
jgi:hypothetical protein